MSWQRGPYGGYSTGSGIKRKEVNGPCPATLEDGETHTMRYPIIKTILGIEYKTGNKFAKGFFDETEQHFIPVAEIGVDKHNACFHEMVNPIESEPIPETTETVEVIDETDFFTDQLQQFTQSDVKTNLITAAVAIVVITALTYIALR